MMSRMRWKINEAPRACLHCDSVIDTGDIHIAGVCVACSTPPVFDTWDTSDFMRIYRAELTRAVRARMGFPP